MLVFLPGVAEISALVARLQTHASLLPLPLHSGLQTADQRQCFQRAPARRTKVVVATDIAEASVTIPDVTLVVDCGLHRTVVSDERTGVASLVTARVSRAAAQQRAGRAGRVRAGTAIHLFRRAELETMAAHPTAEVLRAPLDAIVLRARVLAGDDEAGATTAALLGELLQPPAAAAADRADAALIALGALARVSGGAQLTPFGRRLARLPTSPAHARALLTAAALGCLSPVALTVAALEQGRASPFGRAAAAAAAKRELEPTSDHLALVRAAAAAAVGGGHEAVADTRALRETVRAAERLKSATLEAAGGGGAAADARREHMGAVRACLLSGCAQVSRLERPASRAGGGGDKRWMMRWAQRGLREHLLRPHLASVLADGGGASAGDWAASFGVLHAGGQVCALDATVVSPLAVLLFAGDDEEEDGGGGEGERVLHAAGVAFTMPAEDAALVLVLRRRIAEAVNRGGAADADVRDAVCKALASLDCRWSGVPEGWEYDDDVNVYRATADAKLVQKAKPTEPAAAALARRELGKGSLERANADAAAKKAAAREKHAAAAAAAAAAAPTAEEVAAAAARDEAARAAAKEVDKRRTLERAAAAEAAEAKAAAKSSTAAQLKGIAKLLAELELDKYAEAFAAAGYDDAKLKEVAEEVDEDRSEGGAGAAAVDAMIAAVGVKGGSAVKLKRRMMAPPGKGGGRGGGGGGGGGGGKGGGGGGGGGGGKGGGNTHGGGRGGSLSLSLSAPALSLERKAKEVMRLHVCVRVCVASPAGQARAPPGARCASRRAHTRSRARPHSDNIEGAFTQMSSSSISSAVGGDALAEQVLAGWMRELLLRFIDLPRLYTIYVAALRHARDAPPFAAALHARGRDAAASLMPSKESGRGGDYKHRGRRGEARARRHQLLRATRARDVSTRRRLLRRTRRLASLARRR